MKPQITLSTSRKSLHKLSIRQRSRVMSQVRKNVRLKNSHTCNVAQLNNSSLQNISTSSIVGCSSSNLDTLQNNIDICVNVYEDDTASCSSSISHDSETSSFSTSEEPSFSEHLASCFVENNITHSQGNSILSVLKKHTCFSNNLPTDVRSLLNTPRQRVVIYNVEPGQYIHFNLETEIIECLSSVSFIAVVRELELDFSTDGCSLDKSGSIHLWPIQCKVSNVKNIKSIVVGIYKGPQKPHDPNIFFEKFVVDVRAIMANGGINFHGSKIPIKLRCFIADAPARAFILNHRGHMSRYPCSKCKVSGTLSNGHYVFNGMNHPLRTDEEYVLCIDEDHHKEGTSPLSLLPIGMVSQVPFEYMHLVCLGVMKKLLSAWIQGKYSRISKLSGRDISRISDRLNILKQYCPTEFARRPRSLDVYSKYKATEFRQFLLYIGPVVMYSILNKHLYMHFLLLHGAIRVLVSKCPSRKQLKFAELALHKFVLRCDSLYGPNFNSYNVHGLLHLTDDVKRLGNLDSFSAFPYESNMSIFRKYCRKPNQPLQQFFNRMMEIRQHGLCQNLNSESSIRESMSHNTDKNNPHTKIQFNGIYLSIDLRDNCCILLDGSICIVINIVENNNSYNLIVKRFLEVDNFYNIGMESSAFQVYKCGNISRESITINCNEVNAKCYRMPLWENRSLDDSDSDEDDMESSKYIVAAMIHTE